MSIASVYCNHLLALRSHVILTVDTDNLLVNNDKGF